MAICVQCQPELAAGLGKVIFPPDPPTPVELIVTVDSDSVVEAAEHVFADGIHRHQDASRQAIFPGLQ
jgi:hypothetical protein